MATSIDQRDHVRTALRVPPDLHAKLHEAAAANGRSFNAELLARLESSFTPNQELTSTFKEMLQEAVAELMAAEKAKM